MKKLAAACLMMTGAVSVSAAQEHGRYPNGMANGMKTGIINGLKNSQLKPAE